MWCVFVIVKDWQHDKFELLKARHFVVIGEQKKVTRLCTKQNHVDFQNHNLAAFLNNF